MYRLHVFFALATDGNQWLTDRFILEGMRPVKEPALLCFLPAWLTFTLKMEAI
jgi:hypothetical protein